MRKFVILFSLMLALLVSCNTETKTSNTEKENTEENDTSKEKSSAELSEIKTLDELVADAEKNIGKPVYVKGLVNHTCTHSGRRCFLVNDDESLSIRVEAGGDIKSFEKELIGSVIAVKGILREKKMTNEAVCQYEEKVKAKEEAEKKEKGTIVEEEDGDDDGDDDGLEHCSAEMQNVIKMKTWMKDHEKDYYPIYSIDGESYEVVE